MIKSLLIIAAIAAVLAVIDLFCAPWQIVPERHFDVLEDDIDEGGFYDDDRR